MTSTSLNYNSTSTNYSNHATYTNISSHIDPYGVFNSHPVSKNYYCIFNSNHKWAGYYYKVRALNEDKALIFMYQSFDKGWLCCDNINHLRNPKELTDEIIKEEKIQPLNVIDQVL